MAAMLKGALLIVIVAVLGACSTVPPSNSNNICAIFSDKPRWYKDSRAAEQRWGSTIPVMMSIMYQESQFKHNARTARTRILWVFPGPRRSDAYGYPQARDAVWNEYQHYGANSLARRDNFGDAIDFIGWYNKQSQKRSNIAPDDPYHLYLAYHEGHGGFNRGTYAKKTWLLNTARQVASRATRYAEHLAKCEDHLRKGRWAAF